MNARMVEIKEEAKKEFVYVDMGVDATVAAIADLKKVMVGGEPNSVVHSFEDVANKIKCLKHFLEVIEPLWLEAQEIKNDKRTK